MKHGFIQVFIGCVSLYCLAACSHLQVAGLPSSSSGNAADIDHLIVTEQFEAAELWLQRIGPSDSVYDQLPDKQAALKKAKWRFERSVIKQAVALEQKHQWVPVKTTYKSALKKLPDSKIIKAAWRQFDGRQAVRGEVIRAELLLNEGERLVDDGRLYRQITDLKPSSLLTKLEIKNYRRKCMSVAKDLHEYGLVAMTRKDYLLARRLIVVASQLDSTPDIKQLLVLVQNKIRPTVTKSTVAGRTTSDGKQKLFGRLVAKYKHVLATGDLLMAKQHMSTLRRNYALQPEFRALWVEFQGLVNDRVSIATERGRELYSGGDVQEALHVWKKVLPLDPENTDLKSKIMRAERVLENIRLLTEQQSG